MSKIEVDQVDPQSGTTLTLGTSGDTVSIPSGVTLANAGTATGFASIAWQSSIVTAATHTAAAGQGLWLDTSSNAITLTLPASPSVGDQIIFTDYARNWGSNAVTLSLNGSNFQGNSSPAPVYNTVGESVDIVFSGSTKGWIPNTDGTVTFKTAGTYSADFLVVAGGGAGGSKGNAGGGGAGGFRTSTQTLTQGNAITVTIGDGGAGTVETSGNDGSDSSFSSPGLTTITSTGGGGGGYTNLADGRPGGSGGGSGNNGAAGSGNTPATSPSQGNNGGTGYNGAPGWGGGGGGGASAVGQTPGASDGGGDGGAGSASSITGSSVTYAGGGGGGWDSGPAGAGGAGGGGTSTTSGVGGSGTANTGGGGGASEGGSTSGAGGKGVIIISVPDANYSGSTSGSPTVVTNAGGTGKTVMTFTGTGSYTI